MVSDGHDGKDSNPRLRIPAASFHSPVCFILGCEGRSGLPCEHAVDVVARRVRRSGMIRVSRMLQLKNRIDHGDVERLGASHGVGADEYRLVSIHLVPAVS